MERKLKNSGKTKILFSLIKIITDEIIKIKVNSNSKEEAKNKKNEKAENLFL